MTIDSFLQSHDFDRTLMIGYYGGGNYGDELLLEVQLAKIVPRQDVQQVSVAYFSRVPFRDYHLDNPKIQLVDFTSWKFVNAMLRSKSIIIGGGGLWGMDVNLNIFILSILLWMCCMLGKQIHLLGVGYYGSTTWLGHQSAWLAAKAARTIIARDAESVDNFKLLNHAAYMDHDIAFLAPNIPRVNYLLYIASLESSISLKRNMVFITFRNFRGNKGLAFEGAVEKLIRQHQDVQFLLGIMEPRAAYPAGAKKIRRLAEKYNKNTQILDNETNPLGIFFYFLKHAANYRFITPQFHCIITAMAGSISFFPVAYDNKISRLLEANGISPIAIESVTYEQLDKFVTGEVIP